MAEVMPLSTQSVQVRNSASPVTEMPDVEQQEEDLSRSVIYQAMCGNLERLVGLLEEDPSRVDATDAEGNTPLIIAAFEGHTSLCEYLIQMGANINAANDMYKWTALVAAAHHEDLPTLTILLSHEPNVNHEDTQGMTALDYVLSAGSAECAELLRSAGAKCGSAFTTATSDVEVPSINTVVTELPMCNDFALTYRIGFESRFVDPENPPEPVPFADENSAPQSLFTSPTKPNMIQSATIEPKQQLRSPGIVSPFARRRVAVTSTLEPFRGYDNDTEGATTAYTEEESIATVEHLHKCEMPDAAVESRATVMAEGSHLQGNAVPDQAVSDVVEALQADNSTHTIESTKDEAAASNENSEVIKQSASAALTGEGNATERAVLLPEALPVAEAKSTGLETRASWVVLFLALLVAFFLKYLV